MTEVAVPQSPPTGAIRDRAVERYHIEHYLKHVKAAELLPVPAQAVEIEHSGPQGKVKPLTIIDDPADWTSTSLKGKEAEYTYQITDTDIKELLQAVEKLKARGVETEDDVLQLKKEDYDLPTLAPRLIKLVANVSTGRGFQLLRGFPVDKFKGDRLGLVLAFWGLGLVLGRPQVSQTDWAEDGSFFGSVLNHVTSGRYTAVKRYDNILKTQAKAEDAKRFRTDNHQLQFHSDQGATDLIALLSVNKAKAGGASQWVSGVAIHNELLRRGRKDLVEALSDRTAWNTPRKVDQATYERNADGSFAGFEASPPFEYHDGYLTVHFDTNRYQEIEMTPLQQEAVWAFAKLAEDPAFHLEKVLEPGEIEILHNATALHSRGDIFDGETPEDIRHLLRWWIAQPKDQNPRPTAPSFAPRSLVPPEGGFRVPEGSKLRLPFYPYSRHDGEGQSSY